jgi:thiol:disulfide interchange protein
MAGMMAQKVADKNGVELINFDIIQNQDMLDKYNIKAVPTILVVNEAGEELKRLTNFGEIAAQLEKTIMELR